MNDEATVSISTQAVVHRLENAVDEQTPNLVRLRRYATEISPLPLVVTAGVGHIVSYANPAFCGLCGKANGDLIGSSFTDAVPEEKENGCGALLDRVYRTGETETLPDQEHAPSRLAPIYWSYTAWALCDEEQQPIEVMIQVTDTTEAALSRQKLGAVSQALLVSGIRQHELIEMVEMKSKHLQQAMRETDHRVKNNLQLIGALLDMQIMIYTDTVPVGELTELRMQIKTLAAVHEMLVKDIEHDPRSSHLSVQEMLQKLIPMLQQVVGARRIVWSADNVRLSSKQGSSLALLVNELVANAAKHGGTHVEIRITAAAENVILEVQDDGPGFAPGFDPKVSANFGLELVETLSRHDLGGKTTYENRPEGGACVRVTFPYLARE